MPGSVPQQPPRMRRCADERANQLRCHDVEVRGGIQKQKAVLLARSRCPPDPSDSAGVLVRLYQVEMQLLVRPPSDTKSGGEHVASWSVTLRRRSALMTTSVLGFETASRTQLSRGPCGSRNSAGNHRPSPVGRQSR